MFAIRNTPVHIQNLGVNIEVERRESNCALWTQTQTAEDPDAQAQKAQEARPSQEEEALNLVGDAARLLIIFGAAIVLAGLVMLVLDRLGLPRLPGDLVIRTGGVRIYIPITTSLLLSVVLTLIFRLLHK